MTKARVPHLWGDDGDMATRWHAMWNRVEVPVAIAPKESRLSPQILDRKTRGVKLNGIVIVASKLSNR